MPNFKVTIKDAVEYIIEAGNKEMAQVQAEQFWSERIPCVTVSLVQSRRDRIKEVLEDMATEEVVNLWNEYCDRTYYTDDKVYPIESFNDFLSGQTPLAIVGIVEEGSVCSTDEYFWMDGLGHFHSADYADEIDVIDLDDLAEYMNDYETSLDNSTIQDVFDEYATDEEESEGDEA